MLGQITGDDTPALQAVLDADVWRKHLLAEQEVKVIISSAFSRLIPLENQQTAF